MPGPSLLRIPVPWVFVLAYLFGVALEFATRFGTALDRTKSSHGRGRRSVYRRLCHCRLELDSLSPRRNTRVPGEKSSALIASGPFRISRNPMYVGLTLAYLGEAAMLRQLWPPVLLPLVLIYLNRVVIPLEETRLREVFGDSYEAYCRSVRRWF